MKRRDDVEVHFEVSAEEHADLMRYAKSRRMNLATFFRKATNAYLVAHNAPIATLEIRPPNGNPLVN